MNKNTFTAGLIIVLSLCVMGTAVLSYYYILSIRRLGRAHTEWYNIQQLQTKLNYFSRDALRYGLDNPDIMPVLESYDIRLRTVGSPEIDPMPPTASENNE